MATSAAAQLFVGAKTDVGTVRSRNEDSILCEPTSSPDAQAHGWLGIVADGLGGHRSGNIASQLAVQTTRDVFYTRSRDKQTRDRLRTAVQNANQVIITNGLTASDKAEMASTITAAVIKASKLTVAQVGDSRGYLVRNSRLKQITTDHSLVEEMVRNGGLTAEQALHHPNRNVITRALGTKETVQVDVFEEELRNSDVVVLCSDGLYRVVAEAEIARALFAEPQQAADSLVALANSRGAPDNVSVIIVRVSLTAEANEGEVTQVRSPQG
jgi:PPM family protein phosphatase